MSSVAAVAARRLDHGQRVKINIDDGLKRLGCRGASKCVGQGFEPGGIGGLKFDQFSDGIGGSRLSGGCGDTGGGWPSHRRSTPELDQLQARLSALMPYRVAAGVLLHLLPIDAGRSPETLRTHTLQVGKRLGDAAAEKPPAAAAAITISLDSRRSPKQMPRRRSGIPRH